MPGTVANDRGFDGSPHGEGLAFALAVKVDLGRG